MAAAPRPKERANSISDCAWKPAPAQRPGVEPRRRPSSALVRKRSVGLPHRELEESHCPQVPEWLERGRAERLERERPPKRSEMAHSDFDLASHAVREEQPLVLVPVQPGYVRW